MCSSVLALRTAGYKTSAGVDPELLAQFSLAEEAV
jgi:hypothetical protein